MREEFLKKAKEKYGFEKMILIGDQLVINKNPKLFEDIYIWVDFDFSEYMIDILGSELKMEISIRLRDVECQLKKMDYFSENPKSWWVNKKDVYEEENIEWL